MKKNNAILPSYKISDLSNPHFRNIEIHTVHEGILKGEFVEFKVLENNTGYKIYPSEKLCFLPIENKTEFWNAYKINNGIFNELPLCIKEMGLDDIKKIIIEPVLIQDKYLNK